MSPISYDVQAVVHNRLTHRALMQEPLRNAFGRIGRMVLPQIQRRTPSTLPATGTAVRSIAFTTDPSPYPRYVRFYSNLAYIHVVELGRRPGGKQPPIAALLPWVRRAGLPASAAYPIARAIAIRGTRGRFMFRDGIAASRPAIDRYWRTEFMRDVRGWRRRRGGV